MFSQGRLKLRCCGVFSLLPREGPGGIGLVRLNLVLFLPDVKGSGGQDQDLPHPRGTPDGDGEAGGASSSHVLRQLFHRAVI